MNELIEAAKAVIDLYDYTGTEEECEAVNRLSDAVERAEKQEAVGFNEYMKTTFGFTGSDGQIYSMPTYKKLWIAAQQAERERIKSLIADIGTSGKNECWDCCETILEKIDEVQS